MLLLAGLLVIGTGCPKKTAVQPARDADQELAEAIDMLRQKKYKPAEEALTHVIFNYPGTHVSSDAQFYLAECYYERGDYTQAQTEYEFYIQNFPSGRFQSEAALRLAFAYLKSAPSGTRDQSRVLKARDMLDEFIGLYPDSPLLSQAESARATIDGRLAGREFEAARLYFKAGEYRSALVYYDYVNQTFADRFWEQADRERFAECRRRIPDATSAARPVPPAPEILYFEHGSVAINPADSTALVALARRLSERPEIRVTILGHCDSIELRTGGETLARRRADAVRELLVALEVSEARLTVESIGAADPISTSERDRALDRRVEVLLR